MPTVQRRPFAAVFAGLAAAIAVLALVPAAVPGGAAHAQAAPPAPLEAKGLEVVGYNDLGQASGLTSEIWYQKQTVYVGYYCGAPQGSSIVDVSDPANPTVLFKTDTMSGTFASDVSAVSIDTAAFTGDLFVEPHETCRPGAVAELRIWDVTNPRQPALLSSTVTVDGVHNASPFLRTENGQQKAYLLLSNNFADTADNSDILGKDWEAQDMDADFVIMDITDPRAPSIVSRWNIHTEMQDLPASTFMHDAWLNAAGTVAYAAYWDAGVILLDVSDVTKPTLISQTRYPAADEGNTHQVVETRNGDFLVVTDEDFNPLDSTFVVTEPAPLAGKKPASPGSFLRVNIGQPPVEGDAVWVGRGCDADPAFGLAQPDPYLSPAVGKIAVIVRGGCSFAGKVKQAQANGAIGAVVVNNVKGAGPVISGRPAQGTTIAAIGIAYDDGHAITTTLAAGTAVKLRYGVLPGEWGYTRFFDARDPKNLRQVADFRIPETRQYPPAAGTYTVHNPWIDGDTLYLSHYSGGVRVLDIADPARPSETAHMVTQNAKGERGSVWGVMTDERGYIYLSDMVAGLWVLRHATAAVPTPTVPPTPSPAPSATPAPPIPTPAPTAPVARGPVCPQVAGRVPQAVLDAAVADPAAVEGYRQPHDPGKPVGPFNPLRVWLTLHDLAKPFHPVANSVVFRAYCP